MAEKTNCARCGESVDQPEIDPESIAEYETNFECEWKPEEVEVVCDPCYEDVLEEMEKAKSRSFLRVIKGSSL